MDFYTSQTIGNNIRKTRKKAKLNQEQFGKKLAYSRRTVGRIENGEKILSPDEVVNIACFFNISCDELLRGQKPEYFQIENATGLKQEAINSIIKYSKLNKHMIDLINIILSIDIKESRMLLNALYLYVTTSIDDVKIEKSSWLTSSDKGEFEIKKQALWSAVESYVRAALDKIRCDFTDVIINLSDDEVNKLLKEIMQDGKSIGEKVNLLEDSYYGRDFHESELK